MKRRQFLKGMLAMALVFGMMVVGCDTPTNGGDGDNKDSGGSDNGTPVFAEKMWGEWLRMDAKETWYISGASIKINGNPSSRPVTLAQPSDRVIEVTEGGGKYYLYASRIADASFTGRVAGIDQTVSSISSMLMSATGSDGRTVEVENIANGLKKTVQTKADGTFTVSGIIPGDKYKITPEGGTPVTVTPVADGDDVGTITVAQGVNFKSGVNAKDSSTDMNQLYAQETYTFNLVVENTGNADCTAATYQLQDDDSIVVSKPSSLVLGTIEPGKSKTLEITVRCPSIQKESEFKKIGITITDPINNKTWADSVSLKFHKGKVNLYIESNKPVYGIVIAPNGKTYSVLNVTSETFTFPSSANDYLVVFSGATADTEVIYSFGLNVKPDTNWTDFSETAKYEPNDKEADAPLIGIADGKIMAYLHKDDRDYYRVNFGANAPGSPSEPDYGITLKGTESGAAYAVRVYPFIRDEADEWTDATADEKLAAKGEATAEGAEVLVSLSAPDESRFAGTDSFLVVVTAGETARYAVAAFLDGSTALELAMLREPPETPDYSISLSQTETLVFAEAVAGYAALTPATITISNTGNKATGRLTVALSGENSGAFTRSPASIASIAADGSATFTVVPKTGQKAGTYTATVTVSGSNIEEQSFEVSFDVGAAVYGIELSEKGTLIFDDAILGYKPLVARDVTITNTGDAETGELTIALSGDYKDFFSLGKSKIDNITVNGTAEFTVVPKGNLAVGTHGATVTVSGSNGISEVFGVSFEVTPVPAYGISLSQTGTLVFPPEYAGYGAQTVKSVIISNTGNQPTGGLAIGVTGADFTLSKLTIDSLAVDGTDSFAVVPKTGRPIGTYTATVSVTGGNGISASFEVSFEVKPVPVYGIELSQSQTEPLVFKGAPAGYGERTPQAITITNTGNQPTGDLTVSLSGANGAFTVEPATIGSIAAGETASFTVAPNTGLEEGPYIASVTVSGGNGILKGFYVSFTVTP